MNKPLLSFFVILLACLPASEASCQQLDKGLTSDGLSLQLISARYGDYHVIDMFLALRNNGANNYLYNSYTTISRDDKLIFERVLLAKITVKLKNDAMMSFDVIEPTNLGRSRPVVLTPRDPRGKPRVEILGVSTTLSDILNCIQSQGEKYNLSDVKGIIVRVPIYEYSSPELKAVHTYVESSLIDLKTVK